ncbi:TetR/AcrR family transcriptional regulator [Corticicoccus populi]|uniref:TetR/AcrR family transcriptional regulator n=1 Tax=Corticicoccus populi TaxID=1812821 RepID=A0ABW5WUI1_9STAP
MKKGINSDSIINAALNIIDNEGIEQLSIKKIADFLNIKPPSLYNHIQSLNQIIDLCAMESLAILLKEIEDVLNNSERKISILYEIACAYRYFAHKYPGRYKLTQSPEYWHSRETHSKADNIIIRMLQEFSDSNISKESKIHFLRIFRSYLHGFITLELNQSFQLEQDIDESFQQGIHLFTENFSEHLSADIEN